MLYRAISVVYCVLLVAVWSSNGEVSETDDKINAICTKKCSPSPNSGEQQTHEACMLKCRNYIEETMFRPRVLDDESTSSSPPVSRQPRAAGRSHAFVRVGKAPTDNKRSQMRGSFVRIGRQLATDTDDDYYHGSEPGSDGEASKRRSDFVRIGRRGRSEQFVRIGRGSDDASDPQQDASKRAAKQAFVRIGRKPANFVRIGRAFVRIGKNYEDDDGEMAAPPENDGEDTPMTATADEE